MGEVAVRNPKPSALTFGTALRDGLRARHGA
jgi:hypothetical protein